MLEKLFFQVVKCLNRLQEIGIYDKVADLKNKFPRSVLYEVGFILKKGMGNDSVGYSEMAPLYKMSYFVFICVMP